MASYIKQITEAIEDRLLSVIPTFIKSIHTFSKLTGSPKAKYSYRVLPGEAESGEGVTRKITYRQKFNIFLDCHYKADTDVVLQVEVETLYASLELVTSEAIQKRFSSPLIMNVESVALTAPEINHDDKIVTIGASYSVLYRME